MRNHLFGWTSFHGVLPANANERLLGNATGSDKAGISLPPHHDPPVIPNRVVVTVAVLKIEK